MVSALDWHSESGNVAPKAPRRQHRRSTHSRSRRLLCRRSSPLRRLWVLGAIRSGWNVLFDPRETGYAHHSTGVAQDQPQHRGDLRPYEHLDRLVFRAGQPASESATSVTLLSASRWGRCGTVKAGSRDALRCPKPNRPVHECARPPSARIPSLAMLTDPSPAACMHAWSNLAEEQENVSQTAGSWRCRETPSTE